MDVREQLLRESETIAVVGLSNDTGRASYQVARYLQSRGYRIIPVNPEVSEVLIKCAREKDTRRCLLLLGTILETPGLSDRLLEALRPASGNGNRRNAATEGRRIR